MERLSPKAGFVIMSARGKEQDRIKGAMLGLAVGDAMGVTLNGLTRDSVPKVIHMAGGGPMSIPAGDWTDKTSLAIALASALVSKGTFDAKATMEAFSDWFQNNSFCPRREKWSSIGYGVEESIETYINTGHGAHPNITEVSADPIVRVAPIVIAFRDSATDCAVYAKRQCSLTHGHEIVKELCAHFALGMRNAIIGAGKDRTLAGFDALTNRIGRWRGIDRERVDSQHPAVKAFKSAIWAVDSSNTFEEAVIIAVNLAGESCATGAIAGQLAGAVYGFNEIPDRWLKDLAWRDVLSEYAYDLGELNR
jgi:ADP-ribosyl-[dinitrogen reductase] hydrolase